jgi:glycine cleavage system H protein
MEAKTFDHLAARLASDATRRDTVKGLVGGGLAAVGLASRAAGADAHAPHPRHHHPGPPGSPPDRKYTMTHEWVSLDGDVATIGITDFAQSALGAIVYLQLSSVGAVMAVNQAFGVVESVKVTWDIHSPVDGAVVARNEQAVASPALINQSPYEQGWLVRGTVADPHQLDTLMSGDEYDKWVSSTFG